MKIKKIIYWIPSIVWMTIMFIMTSITIETEDNRTLLGVIVLSFRRFLLSFHNRFLRIIAFNMDKVYHAFEYAVFTILLNYALLKTFNWNKKKHFLILSSIIVIVAIIDELHQIYLPSRYTSMGDLIADIIGMLIIYIFIFSMYLIRRKNEI